MEEVLEHFQYLSLHSRESRCKFCDLAQGTYRLQDWDRNLRHWMSEVNWRLLQDKIWF